MHKLRPPAPTATASAAPLGPGRRPQPHLFSNRFRFCPAAISRLSLFTFSKPRSLNRSNPCHCFASPNKGSTHTLRLAFSDPLLVGGCSVIRSYSVQVFLIKLTM